MPSRPGKWYQPWVVSIESTYHSSLLTPHLLPQAASELRLDAHAAHQELSRLHDGGLLKLEMEDWAFYVRILRVCNTTTRLNHYYHKAYSTAHYLFCTAARVARLTDQFTPSPVHTK